ncbi:MAG: biotin carboxylase N-terminal domain-containing protein, partial [Hungatella sp.]
MFNKILIANRGEIAVRIIRACREMGIKTVAVYSEADRESLHTLLADEAICIGPAPSSQSYLNMERILTATVAMKADAIHPGFGFLSENARFAELCEKCKITFIGPSAEIIHKRGNKSEARKTMLEAGVPVVPGSKEPVYTVEEARRMSDEIGYPVMIKASSGGGGKGMRISYSHEDFETNFQNAQMESIKGFSDDTMYI